MATPRKDIPTTAPEVAAAGLHAAIKLVALNDKMSEHDTIGRVSRHLKCNVRQLERYVRCEGLPLCYIESMLFLLKAKDIPFGRHQLKPTKAVLAAYGIGPYTEAQTNG